MGHHDCCLSKLCLAVVTTALLATGCWAGELHGPEETVPTSADPGDLETDAGIDPGNTVPGTTDPGTTDPGNTDPGDADAGNTPAPDQGTGPGPDQGVGPAPDQGGEPEPDQGTPPPPPPPPPPSGISYKAKIQPMLDAKCLRCHKVGKAAGAYRVDDYAATMKAGATGEPAVTPGDPAKSLIWFIEENSSCPLCWHAYFSAGERADLKKWITQGAKNN